MTVSHDTPCQAYAVNTAVQPLIWLASLIPTITTAYATMLILTGNVAALLEALGAAAGAVAAFAPQLLQVVAIAVIVTYVMGYVDCQTNFKEPARYCARMDPRAPTGSGGGRGEEYDDTGTVYSACGLMCDPSRRSIIDDWRNGIRPAE